MDRLATLFQLIVDTLIERDPALLHQPITVGMLRGEVVPYRVARRPLQLDCAEDHDMLLLRLVSGEGDYVRVGDPAAVEEFQGEVVGVNPDLRVLETHAVAELTFDARALARALGSVPARDYRPPEVEPPREETPGDGADPMADIIRDTELVPVPDGDEVPDLEPTPLIVEGHCAFCGGVLPEGRTVVFCPHCGQGLESLRCPGCGSEVEEGWRHCIACGTAL